MTTFINGDLYQVKCEVEFEDKESYISITLSNGTNEYGGTGYSWSEAFGFALSDLKEKTNAVNKF